MLDVQGTVLKVKDISFDVREVCKDFDKSLKLLMAGHSMVLDK